MSEGIIAALKRALGDKSPLPIDEINVVCKVIAEEEPLTVLTSDKLYSIGRKLRQPVKVILSYDVGLEALLVLFGSLGERWLGVLGELLAEDQKNVMRCISLFRQGITTDIMRPLLFVTLYTKSRYPEYFDKAFEILLSKDWNSLGLVLILTLFDTRDRTLVAPLNDYLDRLNAANPTIAPKSDQAPLVSALKAAVRKIEGKSEKKSWQFWKH